jgi:hypothetical protein
MVMNAATPRRLSGSRAASEPRYKMSRVSNHEASGFTA